MGMFSYCCNRCGPKDQFDWMDCCVVKLMKDKKSDEDIYVRGQYNGYGQVKVAVVQVQEGQQQPAAGGGGAAASSAIAITPCSMDQWEDGNLVATRIYCNGNFTTCDEAANKKNLMHAMAKAQGDCIKAMVAAAGSRGGGGGGDARRGGGDGNGGGGARRGGGGGAIMMDSSEDDEDDHFRMMMMMGDKDFDSDDSDDDDEGQIVRVCVPKDVTVLDELTQEQFTHAAAASAMAVKRG
jgi:hypothetical protein